MSENPGLSLDFRALFEAVPAPLLVLRPDERFTIVAVNDSYLRATLTTREGLIGRGLFDAFPDNPDDPGATGVQNLRASLGRVLATRAPDRMAVQKYDIPAPDGGFVERHWSPLNTPVLTPEGEVAHILHHVEDVTEVVRLRKEGLERKLVEAGLKQSGEWFSTTLNSIGDAVIATDFAGRVVFMNAVAERLTGWSIAQASGLPFDSLFVILDEATRAPVPSPVDAVLATGKIHELANHTVLVARDGSERVIEDSAAPILGEDGRVTGVVFVFHDASEKRKAELLNERLVAVVESSDDIIASKDLDGVITSWNRGAERILGYTAEEVIGRHVSMLMPPELVEDMPKILDRIRRGEKVDHYQTRRVRKDGAVIDVSLTVSPIRDAEGRVVGASKIGRDITREKLMEAERQEADRRKDEFLAMLSHELRNPLSAINGAAQLFGKLETEEELEWAKEIVQRQVKHLARLIDDLLDVSRISRGKIVLRKETIDLSPVVGGAVESVRPLLEERKHELSISLLNGGLRLKADPLRLEQILVNLLTNAAKYTDAGGRISLMAKHEGQDIVIRVRDTGLGIAPELMPRIFDLFSQGDRTAARSEGGLGIGLTLVQKLCQMHGGTVAVVSEGPGKGSEFTVRLPALEEETDRKASPHVTLPRVARQSSRVLVVDDNLDNARGLSRLLKLLGHDVRVAHDGKEAIEVAQAHRPEVVLLDIGLPGMDGYEVVKRLRTDDCCKDALVIAVSGYGQPEDLRRSREAGFDHHLVKPVDYEALMNLLAPQPS